MTIHLQGICYDEKSSFLRGPAKAPPLIRKHYGSDSGNAFSESGVDTGKLQVVDHGDFGVDAYPDIEGITESNISESSGVLTLGGDHSITYPVLKALNKFHEKIDILHIDAHADLYDEFEGDRFSHACPFARIMEEGLAENLVQVGIRTLNDQQREQVRRFNVQVIEMKDFSSTSLPIFQNPLYISLDLDGIDPAFAPGVSHHEPGGLSPRQVIDMLLKLKSQVLGADLVEYNPDRDVGEITGALAGKMMKELLAAISR